VQIKDPNHAFWFKMRWGTDIARFKRSEEKRIEDIRRWGQPHMGPEYKSFRDFRDFQDVSRLLGTWAPKLGVEDMTFDTFMRNYQGLGRQGAVQRALSPRSTKVVPWISQAMVHLGPTEHDAEIAALPKDPTPDPTKPIRIKNEDDLLYYFGRP
jgi:hypothetical protein